MIKRFGVFALACALIGCLALVGCTTETYVPESKTPTVSTPVIGKQGVLRVGVDSQNAPFAAEGSAKVSGLDVDIAAALADVLGLKLEVVDVGSDPDKALNDGTVDIVMGIDAGDTTVTCWISDAYLQSGVALFGAPGAAVPGESATPKVAAQSSSMSAWEVTDQYGTEALVASEDLRGAFTQLHSGQVDYVAADAIIGTYAAYISDVNAEPVALLQKPVGRCIGVADSKTELKTTISDALVKLNGGGIIPVVERKWLGKAVDVSKLSQIGTESNGQPVETPAAA